MTENTTADLFKTIDIFKKNMHFHFFYYYSKCIFNLYKFFIYDIKISVFLSIQRTE